MAKGNKTNIKLVITVQCIQCLGCGKGYCENHEDREVCNWRVCKRNGGWRKAFKMPFLIIIKIDTVLWFKKNCS